MRFDRRLHSGGFDDAFDGLLQNDAVGSGECLRRDTGVGAIDEDQDVRLAAGSEVTGVVGRDLDSHRTAARHDGLLQLLA